VNLASQTPEQQGLPPLPRTTPHTLRRTYISIALPANKFDVKWVMGQVGHADSKMTMDVYAHLQQRLKRQHGEAFDAIIREAEELMHGDAMDDAEEAEEAEPASEHDDE
jgi:integrase